MKHTHTARIVSTLVLLGPLGLAQTAIHEVVGTGAGDRLGFAVATLGDVDGDQVPDYAIGIPFCDGGAPEAGRVDVYSGATRGLLRRFTSSEAGEAFGYAVGAAGDVDGDGRADLVVGAHANDQVATDAGAVYVFSVVDGIQLQHLRGGSSYDCFGIAVDGAGDVNSDGYADVLVGARGVDTAGANAGAAMVYSGFDGSLLHTFLGEAPVDLFGSDVAGVGDVDGDGVADLLIGARLSDASGSGSGSAYVYSGAGGTLLYALRGQSAGDAFGTSVAGAGDLDGDGRADLLVGAPGADQGGTNAGSVQAFSGQSGTVLLTAYGENAGDSFGIAVASAGDVTTDGVPDLLVGAYGDDSNGISSGSAVVLCGSDGSQLFELVGGAMGDRFGFAVSGAGDLTGDGRAEILVGSYGYYNSGSLAGKAQLYSLHCSMPTVYCLAAINSTGAGSFIGSAGTTNVSANDFSLTAVNAPHGEWGIFYYGTQRMQVPFGDGFRCVDGQLFRLPALQVSQAGTALFPLDFTDPPTPSGQITPGATLDFQFWFRDSGPSGFSFSNALEVTFCF